MMLVIGDRVLCNCPGSWVDGKTGTVTAVDVLSPDGIRGCQLCMDGGEVTVVPPSELGPIPATHGRGGKRITARSTRAGST